MTKLLNPNRVISLVSLSSLLLSLSMVADAAAATSKRKPPPPVKPPPVVAPPLGYVCALSADGNQILFTSSANNIVLGDVNNSNDIFIKDVRTGLVRQVNTNSNGSPLSVELSSICGGITPDATSVYFTGTPITAGVRGQSDVFVKNLRTGVLTKASPPAGALPETTGYLVYDGAMSSDGSIIAFVSIPTQRGGLGAYTYVNNSPARILIRDLRNGVLTDLAVAANGALVNGDVTGRPALSADGSKVAFESTSSNLVGGDTNGSADVFVQTLSNKSVALLSSSSQGVQATRTNSNIMYSSLTWLSDGVTLAFFNVWSSTLGDRGLYFKRTDTGELRFVPLPADASFVSISTDGHLVTLSRYGSTTRVTVLDLRTGIETPVSPSPATISLGG